MTVDVLSWQDIASSRPKPKREKQDPSRRRGNRQIPQETIRAIRADAANDVPRAIIAERYGVSLNYIYQVVDNGLRDDERERMR